LFVQYLIRFGKIPTLLVVNSGWGFSVDLGNVVVDPALEGAEPSLPGWCWNIWYTCPSKENVQSERMVCSFHPFWGPLRSRGGFPFINIIDAPISFTFEGQNSLIL